MSRSGAGAALDGLWVGITGCRTKEQIMTDVTGNRFPGGQDASAGELVGQAAEQISRLVRDELALAKAEMTEKGKRAGVGAGLLGSGGVGALYGLAAVFGAVLGGLAGGVAAGL